MPIRDRRDRVIGYQLSAFPRDVARDGGRGLADPDEESRQTVEMVGALTRLAARSLVVPVTPALVRDGAITRFASSDAVWLIATESLDDALTRRAVDRLLGAGFNFALDGYPEGDPLPTTLIGSTVVLDALRLTPEVLDTRIRALLEAGLRPLVRGVEERVTRHRVLAAGAAHFGGRLLARGAGTPVDRTTEDSVVRALAMLAAFADGRPPDAAFDAFVRDDTHLAASLLKAMSSAALGVRGPRSVAHAMTMLGRDAIMDRLVVVTARLIGEAGHDPELAFIALRRARTMERVGGALDNAPHPRARVVAGLLSVLEFALGAPAPILADRLGLPPLLHDVLLERQHGLGQLVDVLDAMEYGWWDDVVARSARIGLAPAVINDAWLSAWRAARDELGLGRMDLA